MTRARRQEGFSYIEVLIAIVVLGIVSLGLVQGLTQASRALANNKIDTVATSLAASQIDAVQRMAYVDVGLVGDVPPGLIPASRTKTVQGLDFTIATTVEYVDDAAKDQARTGADYKRVRVTVTPQRAGAVSITQTTNVTPAEIGSIKDKGSIIATLQDALTDTPLSGVSVTASGSTSPTVTRTSDANGKVAFLGLAPSATDPSDPRYDYVLTPTLVGYVPDALTVGAQRQHLVVGTTNLPTLSYYRPATLTVNVLNGGSPYTGSATVTVTPPGQAALSPVTTTTGAATFGNLKGNLNQDYAASVSAPSLCATGSAGVRVPSNYPSTLTATANVGLAFVGNLQVALVDHTSGAPLVGGAVTVQAFNSGLTGFTTVATGTSGADGVARFCLPDSPALGYYLRTTRSGYGAGALPTDVSAGSITAATIRMPPSASTARIRADADANGRRVRVRTIDPDGGTYEAYGVTSGGNDRATFDGVARGIEYRVAVLNGSVYGCEKRITPGSGSVTVDVSPTMSCP